MAVMLQLTVRQPLNQMENTEEKQLFYIRVVT